MNKLNQLKLENQVGKIIKGVFTSFNSVIFTFEDGSFSFWEEYQNFEITEKEDVFLDYEFDFIKKVCVGDKGTVYFKGNIVDLFIESGIIDKSILINDCKDIIKKIKSHRKEDEISWAKKLIKKYPEIKNQL